MKRVYIILAITLLAGCAGMGSDMSGAHGRSASSIMGAPDQSGVPYSQRVFDPNDPYHGG